MEAKVGSVARLKTETKHHLMHSLKKRYDAKDVILNEALDEKLIAGIRIEVGDEVIDLTMRNKIKQLQEYLIKA